MHGLTVRLATGPEACDMPQGPSLETRLVSSFQMNTALLHEKVSGKEHLL